MSSSNNSCPGYKGEPWEEKEGHVTVSDGRIPANILGKMLWVEDGTDPGPRDSSLLLFFGLELMILLFWLLECLVLRSHYKCLIAC